MTEGLRQIQRCYNGRKKDCSPISEDLRLTEENSTQEGSPERHLPPVTIQLLYLCFRQDLAHNFYVKYRLLPILHILRIIHQFFSPCSRLSITTLYFEWTYKNLKFHRQWVCYIAFHKLVKNMFYVTKGKTKWVHAKIMPKLPPWQILQNY